MAKTKEVVMLAPVEPSGEVRVDMSKEDLVTVGLVEIENELNKRHDEAKSRLSACHKVKDELSQQKAKLLQKWQAVVVKEVLALWQPQLKAVLGPGRVKNVSAKVALSCGDSRDTECATVVQLNESYETHGRNCISNCRPQVFMANYGATFTIPDDVRETARTIEELGQSIRQEEALILEIKQKLGSMGRFERQLRAELVKARLSSTEEGRKLLAVITQDLTERIGLPAPQ